MLLVTAHAGFPKVPQPEANPTTAASLFNGYAAVDNIEIYKPDMPPFYRMFNLVTNFAKMNNTDYIQYALVSTTYLIISLYINVG